MLAELDVLKTFTGDPQRPYAVVLGGSKVSDKLAVIEALLPKVDRLLVGGGMCFTFLAAQGHGVGSSLLETDMVDTCKRLLADAGDKLMLPTDVVVADAFSADAAMRTVPITGIEDGWMGLDVGPETVAAFGRRSGRRARCSWNGPMGVFEMARSPRAPEVLRRRSPNRTRSASSAAATRPPPCVSSGCPRTVSRTSPPAAGPRWNTSRARTLPGVDVLE